VLNQARKAVLIFCGTLAPVGVAVLGYSLVFKAKTRGEGAILKDYFMTSPSACLVHNNCNARGLENLIAHCFCTSWLTAARSFGTCIAVPRLFQLSAFLIVMIMYDLHTDDDDDLILSL